MPLFPKAITMVIGLLAPSFLFPFLFNACSALSIAPFANSEANFVSPQVEKEGSNPTSHESISIYMDSPDS
jgi:hypothetical protein